MDIEIVKAKPEDAQELLEYLKKIGGESDNLTFGAEGLPFSKDEEAEYIKSAVMFLAKHNGKIVGDASLSRMPRRMSHRAEFGVSVLKEYHNLGVGSRLTKQIIDTAKQMGLEIIDLQVRSDNAPAIHLYEKFGFKKLFTYPDFFKIGNEYVDFDYMYLKL